MTSSSKKRPSDQPSTTPEPRPGAPMAPADEAPAGTPGTGENICRRCGGSGRANGSICPDCQGSGKIIEGIGGA